MQSLLLLFLIQALELLGKWNPMDVEDALELLSSQFTNRAVRHYAVSRLKEANDDVSKINLGNNVHNYQYCVIRINQGRGKCYQLIRLASALIIPDITKT